MPVSAKYGSPESIFLEYRQRYVDTLHRMGEEYLLPKGKLLQQEDIYYLERGKCALCLYGNLDEEQSLIYFYPGRLLNFLPCLSKFYPSQHMNARQRVPRHFFVVRAVSDCRLLRIPCDIFFDNYFGSLELHSLIVHSLIDNIYDLFSRAFKSPRLSADQRICRVLFEIMNENYQLERVTYAEISAHLSVHPVTVAKIFKALRQSEIISNQRGNITVINPDRLRRIAEGKERLAYKTRADRR